MFRLKEQVLDPAYNINTVKNFLSTDGGDWWAGGGDWSLVTLWEKTNHLACGSGMIVSLSTAISKLFLACKKV